MAPLQIKLSEDFGISENCGTDPLFISRAKRDTSIVALYLLLFCLTYIVDAIYKYSRKSVTTVRIFCSKYWRFHKYSTYLGRMWIINDVIALGEIQRKAVQYIGV